MGDAFRAGTKQDQATPPIQRNIRTEMSEPKDGGPAFPMSVDAGIIGSGCGPHVEWGMTLRAYLAAQAMNGILANPNCDPVMESNSRMIVGMSLCVADRLLEELFKSSSAEQIADAMLAERAKAK